MQIVLDTNVLVAALRSPFGASYRMLRLLGQGHFEVHVSVPLILEFESVGVRHLGELPITEDDVEVVLDYICLVGIAHEIYTTWRPFLPDPDDDMVLEVGSLVAATPS
jgi:predicted nucleic acid-binding protein